MPSELSSGRNGRAAGFSGWPQPQKIAVIFLSVLALLILIFWLWQMQTQIVSPFAYNGNTLSTLGASTATSSASLALLKQTDTDGDGLSDYDEIYIYHTSPYLADTNSDGLTDLQDIEQGKDPNCPAGQTCSGDQIGTATTSPAAPTVPASTPNDLSPTVPSATSSLNLNTSGVNQASLQQALSGSADAATLRQLLLQSGADPTELSHISDADLMKSYQETLQSQSAATGPAATSSPAQ